MRLKGYSKCHCLVDRPGLDHGRNFQTIIEQAAKKTGLGSTPVTSKYLFRHGGGDNLHRRSSDNDDMRGCTSNGDRHRPHNDILSDDSHLVSPNAHGDHTRGYLEALVAFPLRDLLARLLALGESPLDQRLLRLAARGPSLPTSHKYILST